MGRRTIGEWKAPFSATAECRRLILCLTLFLAAVLVLVFEVLPLVEKRGQLGAAAVEAELHPPGEAGASRVLFDGVLRDVRDRTPVDERGEPYHHVLGHFLRHGPDRFPPEGGRVEYAALLRWPERLRGETVRILALYVHSDPIRLERPLHGREWVHRTYLVDPSGDEGYVVDLAEEPRLPLRALAAVDAVFYKIATYEGAHGEVKAPLLLGRRLLPVKARR